MILVSNIKNLLGDMDFEEFEELREAVLNEIKDTDMSNIIELCCTEGNVLYKFWMQLDGQTLLKQWLFDHKDVSDKVYYMDLMRYLSNNFVEWLEGVN